MIKIVEEMDLQLRDRIALVIGATGGIGKEVSLSLTKNSARVILHYYKNEEEAKKLMEEVEKIGAAPSIIQGDITKKRDCKAIVRKCIKRFGRIDILINALGCWPERDFLNSSREQWDKTLNVNLTSVYLIIKEVIPYMISQQSGTIINIGSECAWLGSTAGRADYAAAKAGLVAFSKTVAKQVAKFNIRVNVVAPGIVYTEMSKNEIEKKHDIYISRIPLGYIGVPKDVANAVIFLASEKSKYITGSTIHVNGGMLML